MNKYTTRYKLHSNYYYSSRTAAALDLLLLPIFVPSSFDNVLDIFQFVKAACTASR